MKAGAELRHHYIFLKIFSMETFEGLHEITEHQMHIVNSLNEQYLGQ